MCISYSVGRYVSPGEARKLQEWAFDECARFSTLDLNGQLDERGYQQWQQAVLIACLFEIPGRTQVCLGYERPMYMHAHTHTHSRLDIHSHTVSI